MSATKSVHTLRLTDDLIAAVASFIVGEYAAKGRDTGRLAVVFGGKRPSLFLRKELARRVEGSFLAPSFFSMEEFIRYVASQQSPFTVLSPIDAAYHIYRLAQKMAPDILAGRETFARFLPWAREITSFIDHVDKEDIPGRLLKSVQKNAEIGYDVPDSINRLLAAIGDIRDAYHAALDERGACSDGLLYLRAARAAPDTPLDEFDAVIFGNLFYLHTTEQALIKSLYDRGKAVLFFQGDEREWPVLAGNGRFFSCGIRPSPGPRPAPDIKLYAGFDMHSQVATAREIVKAVERPERAVVVVPEPEAVIPLLTEISPFVDELNVSLGYPVKRSSLYSLLERIFKAQATRTEDGYYSRDYLKTITHPLVKNIRLPYDPSVTRVLVHKIEELLLGMEESRLGGSIFVKLEDIRASDELYPSTLEMLRRMKVAATTEELLAIVAEFHRLLFSSWESLETFEEFTAVLAGMLDTLVRQSFLSSYPLNIKVVERLFGLIEELNNASFKAERFAPEDIFKILLGILGQDMVSFSGSPLKGLQVLGMLESRSLNFDDVVVLDVNESVVPKLKVYEPLIPRDVMLGLGLDRLEKEEEIQRYHFTRLVSAAKRVHLIYAEDRQREKSRFIEELVWNLEKATKALGGIPTARARFGMSVVPGRRSYEKTDAMAAYLKKIRYSATRVNAYLECPAKFYFHYVMGLQPKEDLADEPDGADVGILIHRVLNDAFKPFLRKKPVIDAAFAAAFAKKLERTFNETFRRKMKSDAFLLKEIIEYRMEQFLNEEKERPVRELLALEENFPARLALGDGLTFDFDARIDRVDRLEDGTALVIDYKTGGADRMPKGAAALAALGELDRETIREAIDSFQLPLYVRHVGERYKGEPVDAALYNLRTAVLSRYFKEGDAESKAIKTDVCMKSLAFIMKEITDPAVPFTPDDRSREQCRACPFFYACR